MLYKKYTKHTVRKFSIKKKKKQKALVVVLVDWGSISSTHLAANNNLELL